MNERRTDGDERQREMERARAIQATSMDSTGLTKIRTDYVTKRECKVHNLAFCLFNLNLLVVGAKAGKVTTTTCSVCGQQIPVGELQEHMRIESLDQRWKEQRDQLEARRAQLTELQHGVNVESSLKSLARVCGYFRHGGGRGEA